MTQYPKTAHIAFKEKYQNLNWSYNEDNFDLWRKGMTGFPIIDAAMGELNTTGYMHNRMRMVVSQFLTKDLFIDWTWGEEYFRQKLIDYDVLKCAWLAMVCFNRNRCHILECLIQCDKANVLIKGIIY